MITKNELLELPKKIQDLEKARARVRGMRDRLTSPQGFDSRERVQSSGSQQAELVDYMIDEEEKIKAREAEIEDLRKGARALFRNLKAEDKLFMTMRYISGMGWSSVSKFMYYSPATVYRKNREILEQLFKE